MHDALVEGIVVGDDDLMERYLGDETIDIAELARRARGRRRVGHRVPRAVRQRDEARSASTGSRSSSSRKRPRRPLDGGSPARSCSRRSSTRTSGHVNLFKVLQGTVKHDDVLTNARSKADERMHQLFSMRGKEQDTVTEVAAGDIAAVAKLADTAHRRRARRQGRDARRRRAARARAAARGRDPAPRARATRTSSPTRCTGLQEEDPVLRIERNAETHQTVLRGMGETHLSIATEKLARKFGVEVETEDVQVAYRETISGTGRGRRASSRSRAAGTASSRSRGCGSSRRSAAPATSSSTRSSAA